MFLMLCSAMFITVMITFGRDGIFTMAPRRAVNVTQWATRCFLCLCTEMDQGLRKSFDHSSKYYPNLFNIKLALI
jgi:hypothetical protein